MDLHLELDHGLGRLLDACFRLLVLSFDHRRGLGGGGLALAESLPAQFLIRRVGLASEEELDSLVHGIEVPADVSHRGAVVAGLRLGFGLGLRLGLG